MPDPSKNPLQENVDDADVRLAERRLLLAAFTHNIEAIRENLQEGAGINCTHSENGLSALHIAVGQNDLSLCRFLIEECGAGFFPDKFGRWPTLVAAECQVDDELLDYIVEQEARYLERQQS